MFCPLCKAEYRQRFSACSEGHISLLTTQEQAAGVAVDRLWTGDDRKKLASILDALLDAGIPFRSRSFMKSQPWPCISMLADQFMKPRPTFEFSIDILDRDRADAVIPNMKNEQNFDHEHH